jgi:hypothetical protein
MKWFDGCKTVSEIKSRYRALAMEHHPDRGGSTRIMQEVNAAYLLALKGQHGRVEVGDDGVEHEYHYSQEMEQSVIDKIAELIALKLPGIEIWLIGRWVWVKGETKPVKDQLAAAGMSWHSKRVAWYWKPYQYRTHYNARVDFDGLARTYGARLYERETDAKIVRQ